MAEPRKRKDAQPAQTANEDDILYKQGLYSGYSIEPGKQGAGFLSRLDLAVYIPVLISIWVFCYIILGLGILPFSHGPVTALALALTGLAAPGVLLLFRAKPGLGSWPADRMAAMTLALMVLDFLIWLWGRPYTGLVARIFVVVDIAGFTALLFCVYMFVYRQLHIEAVVKILGLKAFFDFAAYVLCGGFGIEILSRMGINHPLHLDALFTVGMLELWSLLVYILRYRNKITQLPS